MLMSYLATITKGTTLANEVVAKFNVAYSGRGGMMGRSRERDGHGFEEMRSHGGKRGFMSKLAGLGSGLGL